MNSPAAIINAINVSEDEHNATKHFTSIFTISSSKKAPKNGAAFKHRCGHWTRTA
jgi:hypothetical protein